MAQAVTESKKPKGEKRHRRREYGSGSLVLLKGCKNYFAQYYQNGKQVRTATGTSNKSRAQTILRRLLEDRDRGMLPINTVKKLKYSDMRQSLIDSYVTRDNKSLLVRADGSVTIPGLKALDDYFGDYAAHEITPDAVRKFVKQRKTEGAQNAIINRSLSALRRMFRIAQKDKKVYDVPHIELLKEPKARSGFLEQADFERLLALLPTHLQPLILLLYTTGVRVGEASQIEWGQIDLRAKEIRLLGTQTKNGRPRVLRLSTRMPKWTSTSPRLRDRGQYSV